MMDILQRVEQMLHGMRHEEWQDCCQHGLRKNMEPYVVELHKTKKPFDICHPTMALKIISGSCQARFRDEKMQYLGSVACDSGFEYTSGLGTVELEFDHGLTSSASPYYHNIRLVPLEADITFLLIYPNSHCFEYQGAHDCKIVKIS